VQPVADLQVLHVAQIGVEPGERVVLRCVAADAAFGEQAGRVGVLQNLLARTFQSKWGGLLVASLIFGLSHIIHAPFPNWKYVLLATIAGLFYGHTWMRTGSLFPAALVHALVDISWHVLFR